MARSIALLISPTTAGTFRWETSSISDALLDQTVVPVRTFVICAESATSTLTPPP